MLPVLGYCAATIPVYCKNGGVCYDHLEFGKRCKCAAGFVGMRCELIRKCNYRQHNMLEEMYLRNIVIFKKVYPHKYIYIYNYTIHTYKYIYIYICCRKRVIFSTTHPRPKSHFKWWYYWGANSHTSKPDQMLRDVCLLFPPTSLVIAPL